MNSMHVAASGLFVSMLVGMGIGWFAWPYLRSASTRQVVSAHDALDIDIAVNEFGATDVEDDLLCEHIRAELLSAQRELKHLNHSVGVRRAEQIVSDGSKGWPTEVPRGMRPANFERTLLSVCEALNIEIADLDCSLYPCFALLADSTSDEQFQKLISRFDEECGPSLKHYGAVRFDGPAASYAVACFPRDEGVDNEELQASLRERAFERTRQAVSAEQP